MSEQWLNEYETQEKGKAFAESAKSIWMELTDACDDSSDVKVRSLSTNLSILVQCAMALGFSVEMRVVRYREEEENERE
jgi:hypothetical protein